LENLLLVASPMSEVGLSVSPECPAPETQDGRVFSKSLPLQPAMTITHLAPRANTGGALRHRSSASPVTFGLSALWTNCRIGSHLHKLLPIVIGYFFGSCQLFAATATLAWDPNPESDIAGYLLSYGESPGNYSKTIDAGNNTTTEVTDLIQGKTYYFAVSAYNRAGTKSLPSTEISYAAGSDSYTKNVSPENSAIHFFDSEDPDGHSAAFAIDGDPTTFWHTSWRTISSPLPHELQIDLGSTVDFNEFRYLPRSDDFNDGNIGQYEFYVSADGINWGNPVASGYFPNTKDLKAVVFSQKSGRYVRLRALTDANGGNYTNIAELTVMQSFPILANGENTAPAAIDQNLITVASTSLDITLIGIDPDGNPLTYSIASLPENGELKGTAPNLIYTPLENFSGTDRFTFRANDGSLDSPLATVSITVSPSNEAPTAIGNSFATFEDVPTAVVLAGNDPEKNSLTYAIISKPERGELSGSPPNLTYTPTTDFNGSDHFTFTVNDGNQDSEIATVTLQISAVNDLPVALASSFSTAKNIPMLVSLSGSDKDSDPLAYSIVGGPSNGTLSGSGQTLNYTPKKNFSGSDSFTFRVSDGTANSVPATISVTVTPTNEAPVALANAITTTEDTPILVFLTGADADEDILKYSVVASPSHGSLGGTAPNLTYTPSADFNGSDSFTFLVNDGKVDSSFATVSITVSEFNDMPTAVGVSITTSEDTPVAVPLAGSDPEKNSLTYAIVSKPEHGSLSGIAPNLTYIPAADYHGSDRFTFTVNDGNQNSEIATVTLQIKAVNDLPVPLATSLSTAKNIAVSVLLSGSDKDSDPLSYSIVGSPSNGTLSGSGQTLTYTPRKNFSGNDTFTFVANDGTADSATATVSITVTPTNEAPVALAKTITTAEDTPVLVTLSGTDADEDSLKYSVVANPIHGSLSGTAPNFTYTPSADFNGSDSFTFLVNDGSVDSTVATVSISITSENDSPAATSLILAAAEDTPLPLVLSGSDRDFDPLSFIMENAPSNGTIIGIPPNLTYIPRSNFNGSDQFTFRVHDGTAQSQAATAFITVKPVNDAPSALGKSLSIGEDKVLSVLLEGSDSDDKSLNYSIVNTPSNGKLSGTAPNLSYSPAPDFSGLDSFSYRVNDGKIDSEIATISIEVTPVNDAPVGNSVALETTIDSPRLFVLGGSDPEGDPLTYSIVAPPLNGTLSGKIPNLTYTPIKSYVGSDRITFKIQDRSLESAVATISITVTPGDKETTLKPGIFLIHAITLQANESEPITPEKLVTEPEAGTALKFRKVSGPAWLSVSDDGILSGTPGESDVGISSFVLSVSDLFDLSDEATLTVSVAPLPLAAASINQAPAFINNPITMGDASANANYTGQSLAGQAVDPEDDGSLRYWKAAGPAWLNIAQNGDLSGVPPTANIGQNRFTIGVADSSSSVVFSELLINVTGLPLPWSTANLGTGQIPGTSSYRYGMFTQAGSGVLGNSSDKFFLTYQTLSGDGEIIAKISPVQAAGPSSCIGVMIRDSLSPKAVEAFIGISDDQSYRQVSRTKFGKKSAVKSLGKGDPSHSWVRLVRNAKKRQIYAYRSSDGVNWAHVGTIKVKMQTNCIVGLAVSSGSDSALTTANFSNVWVAP
jgi:F5/8 type C domain/Bacterial Ig domain/Fibronectin type III domain/Putative Ig domain